MRINLCSRSFSLFPFPFSLLIIFMLSLGVFFNSCTSEEKEDEMSTTDALIALAVIQSATLPANSCVQNVSGCSSSNWSCAAATKCYSSLEDCAKSNECPAGSTTTTSSPRVKMKNSSGSSETYGLHTSAGCSNTASYTFGTISNGSESAYTTVNANDYYISYNTPATSYCVTDSFKFNAGYDYTCTSGTTTINCTSVAQ